MNSNSATNTNTNVSADQDEEDALDLLIKSLQVIILFFFIVLLQLFSSAIYSFPPLKRSAL